VRIARALFRSLDLSEDLVAAVVDWIDADADLSGPAGAEDAYYLSLARPYRTANQPMVQVDELHRVRGFDAKTVAKLKPFVTALPGRTPVNANTAPAQVIAAIVPEQPEEDIRAFVARRAAQPFRSTAEIGERWKKAPAGALGADLDVRTSWFSVRILVAQDDVQLASEALVERKANPPGVTAVAWRRPLY
jgi:general secretion pathway protein K